MNSLKSNRFNWLATAAVGAAVFSGLSPMAIAAGVGITVGGNTYLPSAPTETVTAPFTSVTGVPTVNKYSGYVLVTVSGSGQSRGTALSDAFYGFTDGAGNPITPAHDPNYYQLRYSTAPMAMLQPQFDVYNFIVYDATTQAETAPPYTPSYQGSHTYSFVLPVPGGVAANLYFGDSDGIFNDNTGNFSVTVTQLIASDAFQVRYVSNLSVGDSVINITNTGASGASLQSGTTATITGAICANVYAFTPDEQLVSCCSCPVTPNGLVSLSAKNDLASNTLTPAVPTALVVKLVATAPVAGSCTNSAAAISTAGLRLGMASFASTIHATPTAGTYGVTETPFATATLSAGELGRLANLCNFIIANGSGFGVCRSCRLGGLGSVKQ